MALRVDLSAGLVLFCLLFDGVYASVHIPSYYVVETQLRSASENLGNALTSASSVFGSRLEASAKELNEGLQGIGLQTAHELAPKIDAFNAELRNIMGTLDEATARFGNQLLVALDIFALALTDLNMQENGAVGKIANAISTLATAVSAISKEMMKLSDSNIFQEISTKADKAAQALSDELYSIRVFITFIVVIAGLVIVFFIKGAFMSLIFLLVGLLLALVLPEIVPELGGNRDALLCASVIIGALLGMGLDGFLPGRMVYPLVTVLVAISVIAFWNTAVQQGSPLTGATFPSGSDFPPCMYPEVLMKRNPHNTSSFELNEDLLMTLATQKGPYYIVGVVGLYRTGKSTALTLYMREVMKNPNMADTCLAHFGMGHSYSGYTDGVWVWFMPFRLLGPAYRNRPGILVLLDMEGMADPTKPNNGASRLFSFVSLMSSSLIVHLDKNLNLNDLGQLVAVSELAHYLGMEASDSPKRSTQMLPELIFFLLSNQLYVDAPGMKDGTFLISKEIEKILETPNKETDALRGLFPRRRGFAGAALGNGELAELQRIDRVPGFPQKSYSQSVVIIWKQIFADLQPKTFDGGQMDGEILVHYLRRVMDIIACNGEIDVDDFYRHFIRITEEQTMSTLAKKIALLESRLPLQDSEIEVERKALQALIDESISTLKSKLSHPPPTLLKECEAHLTSAADDRFAYLRKLNRLISSYEWVAAAWEPCQGTCPGFRYRVVLCVRGDNKTAAEFKCGQTAKPADKESCHLEDYIWKTEPWEKCNGICPGERSRHVFCSRCDGRQVADDSCKGMTRPIHKEQCDLYSYSWIVGPWPPGCPCGQSRTRTISCQRCDTLVVGQTMCASLALPSTAEFCGSCPPPRRSSCFSTSTTVLDKHGGALSVLALRPGTEVVAAGGQVTEVLYTQVASEGYDLLAFHLKDSQTLVVTPNHILFRGNARSKRANQFITGETLLQVNGTVVISSIEPVFSETRIEIITRARTLVANGVVVSCFDGNELWGHIYNFDLWTLDTVGGVELLSRPWVVGFLSVDLGIGESALSWLEPGAKGELLIVMSFVLLEKLFFVFYFFFLPGAVLWKVVSFLGS